jgi:AraC-like DNA-binding protein
LTTNSYTPTRPCFKQVIHSIWQVEHPLHQFNKEYIIPNGIVEVIFNFSDNLAIPAYVGSKQHYLSNCFISGFNTTPIQVQLPRHQVYFGVLFQPTAVKKIFKVPAGEFANITVDLSLINPVFNSLWHQLAEENNFNKRVTVFLSWLSKNLIEWQPREQLMNDFLYAAGKPGLLANRLAASLCYSPRQLSRKILEATGMNTEEMLRYKKYLHAVSLIHESDLSLTDIAYQSHFADQSHFIKTFKAYTGIAPGDYKRNKSHVKGHLYQDVR